MKVYSLKDVQRVENRASDLLNIDIHLFPVKNRQDTKVIERNFHGRHKALGMLMKKLNYGPVRGTDAVKFPNKSFTLTHSAMWSIAAATLDRNVHGIGVDFETHKIIDKSGARLFLTAKERGRLMSNKMDILSLWTMKEAIYKSDPENNGGWLGAYELLNPNNISGHAIKPGDKGSFYYATIPLAEGVLSVSVCKGRNRYERH